MAAKRKRKTVDLHVGDSCEHCGKLDLPSLTGDPDDLTAFCLACLNAQDAISEEEYLRLDNLQREAHKAGYEALAKVREELKNILTMT